MGYTAFTKQLVEKYIQEYSPKSVVDLGAQNDFSGPHLPAPYISSWYEEKGILYECIDLNGENGAWKYDLGRDTDFVRGVPLNVHQVEFDMVGDMGTSEHVGTNGHFDWEAIYYCWRNKFNLCVIGGIIISENPFSGNWPGHGFNYYVPEFYSSLSMMSDLKLLEIGKHAACQNVTDGWNIFAIMEKTGTKFPGIDEFKTLPLKQS